jgi:formylglycine-generating enzyme required for sulfatase activity
MNRFVDESSKQPASGEPESGEPMPVAPAPVEPTPEATPLEAVAKAGVSEEKLDQPPPPLRHPVPDESAQAQSLQGIKERFQKAYSSTKPHARLALAAQLIGESRKEQDASTERYVLLDEAHDLATREGDLALGLIAAEELTQQFELDPLPLKLEAVRSSVRAARTPAALTQPIEAAFAMAREAIAVDSFDEVLSVLRVVGAAAKDAKGTNLGESVLAQQKLLQHARQLYEESRPAAAAHVDNPEDGEANLTLGLFYCLAMEDWDAGLTMLAKGSDESLRVHAARLVADSSDTAAQLGLADAWWEIADTPRGTFEEKTLLRNAARHWYKLALPRLTGLDLAKARERMAPFTPQTRRTARQPYRLAMGGLAGLSELLPEKSTGKVAPGGGFANFLGKGRIEYPRVPATSYIHEFEITFAQPKGSLTLHYGGVRQGAKIVFVWIAETGMFRCRVLRFVGGTVYWSGEKNYRAGETFRFTLYVNEDAKMLYQNDAPVRSAHASPVDLRLVLYTGDGTAVNLSHCAFRPWTEADAQLRKYTIPPSRVEGNVTEAALQWHGRNIDLGDRPIIKTPEAFVVATTGTPMQWVDAGSFRRTYAGADPPRSPTEVLISQGFWMGRYEVTQAEWARLMPSAVSRVTGSPFLPVDGVRWEDAARFCMLLSEREKKERRLPAGYAYRLPTEAEWEYACRAGSSEEFCTGERDFWTKERSGWRPHEVGTSTANAWGIFDMQGNVAEWCCEKWQELPAKTPFRLLDPYLSPSGKTDLLCRRGGNWWQPETAATCSVRGYDRSEDGGHTGFRIVLGPVLRAK